MKNQIHLELGKHTLEQRGVGDRSGKFAEDEPVQRRIERRQVNRDDRASRAGQPCDQAVADLSAGAGHEDDWSTHAETILVSRRSAGLAV